MTYVLQAGSARRDAARLFGVELRRAMKARGVGQPRLAKASRVGRSSIANYADGENLPTIATAMRLADALDAPRLADIARQGRSRACGHCGRPITVEGLGPRRYCDPTCRRAAAVGRRGEGPVRPMSEGLALLRAEVLRVGPVRKQAVGRALTILGDEREAEVASLVGERLDVVSAAVEAMCRSCEPDGFCRNALAPQPGGTCPLRPASPLPVLETTNHGEPVGPARPWADHPERRLHQATRSREWWAQPGVREGQRAKLRAAWDRLSTAERQARVGAMAAGRRAAR